MSAFLPPPRVWGVFGDDLFEKPTLTDTFLALLGGAEGKATKPFECVGTFAEVKAAVELACRQRIRYTLGRRHRTVLVLPPVLFSLIEALGVKLDCGPHKETGVRAVEDLFSEETDDIVFERVLDRWLLGSSEPLREKASNS